jgi:glycosyltransferase involved in cell wall biosynthesis
VNGWPRVAFFSDSYHGVDGVANTCRNIVKAARRRELPFLAVHAGKKSRRLQDGPIEILELERGPLALNLDKYLKFDLLFARHYQKALETVREFRPDVVHITGPGDVGITGARVAYALGVPLVASWHTNLHEFAGRRLWKMASALPEIPRRSLTDLTERYVLLACLRFYQIARVVLAPTKEQMDVLHERTKKPVFPMRRGIDTFLFSPDKRNTSDRIFRLGFVGRLCPEKNVRFLAEIERALCRDGYHNYRFLIVGDGTERAWLERNLQRADFTGELHGELLAQAYANMDLFVFPSETDTYGNVISESLASGTPVVVTSKGGPKFQVQPGITGYVAENDEDFIRNVKLLVTNPDRCRSLRDACRKWAAGKSWDAVLDDLHDAYQAGFASPALQRATSALAANL